MNAKISFEAMSHEASKQRIPPYLQSQIKGISNLTDVAFKFRSFAIMLFPSSENHIIFQVITDFTRKALNNKAPIE
jgi:hypothetical protein